MKDEQENQRRRSLVWDWPIRLFHWALLTSVIVSWVAVDFLDDTELHIQSGQIVLGLLAFRLAWGVIGPRSAQFHRFIRGPGTIFRYLKGEPVSYAGHNPLGALSVVALLASLLVQLLTGLASDDEIFSSGPLAQFLSDDMVSLANSIHEINWNVLTVLIGLHVAAIAVYWLRGSNLVKPMITGFNEQSSDASPTAPVKARPLWLILVTIAAAAGLAWWVFTL